MKNPDFLIIGGGIVGLCIARSLRRLFPTEAVWILDKENSLGRHGSGRNSGVLHAGFYYGENSLKAKFCRKGNQYLTQYCLENGLKINQCGKLVVARSESDLLMMDELMKRGKTNKVLLEMLSEKEAKKIEPRVKTAGKAIFSPHTSSVDPLEIINSLKKDAEKEAIQFHLNEKFLKSSPSNSVITNKRAISAGYVINAAGLYADKVARCFGFGRKYKILPFKGIYLYSSPQAGRLRTHIYPVPDLHMPFLGVHFTLPVCGQMKIGPTAIPAFWREQYGGFRNFKFSEFAEILSRQFRLLAFAGFNFKQLAAAEMKKYIKPYLVKQGAQLLSGISPKAFKNWGEPGIRAQLVNIKKNTLEMDFVLEGDRNSYHVLNAVSPGFTCSQPFAQYICGNIQSLVA